MNELREEEFDQFVERVRQVHLSDAELGRHYDGAIDEFNASRIKGHLKRCGSCTERYAAMAHILDTYHEVEVTQEMRDQMKSIIARVDLQRAIQASLIAIVGAVIVRSRRRGARFAGASQPVDGQTEDGSLRWRIVETEVYVEVRVWSHRLELEGMRVAVRIGPITREICLNRVPGDQFGGEVRIEGEELEQLAEGWELVIEKLDFADSASLQ